MSNKDYQEFKKRRDALTNKIGDGVAIIFNANEAIRNRDSHYPYRSDSYFHYFSGFTEPQSALMIWAENLQKRFYSAATKILIWKFGMGLYTGQKKRKNFFYLTRLTISTC